MSNKITLTLGRGRDSMTLMKQQELQQQPRMRRGAARSTKNIGLKSRQRRGMGYKMRCIPSTKTVCKNFTFKGAKAQFCSVVSVSVCTALDWFDMQFNLKLSFEKCTGFFGSLWGIFWDFFWWVLDGFGCFRMLEIFWMLGCFWVIVNVVNVLGRCIKSEKNKLLSKFDSHYF